VSQSAPLVDLSRSLPGGRWSRPLARALESLLGLDQVNRLYHRVGGRGQDAQGFCRAVLADLGVQVEVEPQGLERLKALQGPAMVTANHPLGGRDALLMHLVLGAARPDYRVLANSLLGGVPETRDKLILVDPFGGPQAAEANRRGLREAHRWLDQGGMLGVFPAGEVSWWQAHEARVADRPWAPQAIRLAHKAGASLVPLHISGTASGWLQALARIHPALKTPWLARELMGGPARLLHARLGEPIPAHRLPGRRPESQAAWLRDRTYALAGL
jgi:putative hemolysin